MAVEIVRDVPNADVVPQIGDATPYWLDGEWERSTLPEGIHSRLAEVEKSIMALREINKLRRDDRINKIDAKDMEVEYKGLSPITLEAFDCAEQVLLRVAEDMLEKVREIAPDMVART